jgi:ABC-2 type transport system permease protein
VIRTMAAVPIRLLAILGKELVETARRPGAVISLIAGPFLIMLIFSLGWDGVKRPLETAVVVPPGSGLPTQPSDYQDLAGGGLHVAIVVPDRASAERLLIQGDVDLVVIAPDDPQAELKAGRQSVIEVEMDSVDPIRTNYAGILTAGLASAVNRRIIEGAVQQAQTQSGASSGIPPDVVAAPTRAEVTNLAPTDPTIVQFYGPAVLALVLQHLCITLVAMSLIRERTSGLLELFRVAPVSAAELLIGKVLAFGVLAALVSFVTLVALVAGTGIPVLAPDGAIAAVLILLALASMGVGVVVAVVSDSERQVVQLSLLLLIASVFFSGFVVQVDEFIPAVRVLAFMLPVTHAIHLLQDLLLRGATDAAWQFGALALIASVTLGFGTWRLRRELRPAQA